LHDRFGTQPLVAARTGVEASRKTAPARYARSVENSGGVRMSAVERETKPEEGMSVDATRIGLVVLAMVLATIGAGVLEQAVGVQDASPVYLIAVVVAASVLGTWAAVATSAAAFLIYDFLFTAPRLTLSVSDPAEWLSLVLFLIVAVVIGRLAALQRDRADEADRRVREGVALVAMSHDVAMTTSFEEAAAEIALRLQADAEMDAVWVEVESAPGRAVAWTGFAPPADPGNPWTLVRSEADDTTEWIRLHSSAMTVADDEGAAQHYLASIDAGEARAGWIHATRRPGDPRPGRGARRLLALAADQLAIAHRRDALQAGLTAAEVARQSDALRGAILDSVSHDLRTPVASIRALAGGLADAADGLDGAAVRRTAEAIDTEGERLGDLVNGLLDMGRIQSGGLEPDLQPYDLAELVETTLRHHPSDRAVREIEAAVPDDLPPVLADAVLFDVALGNVVDNAAAHTPPGARVRVTAAPAGDGWVLVAVDDAGQGVPADALPHLFDRFYRVRSGQETARHGMGLGLAIAKGFVEAMGGTIAAEGSRLGGLGIRIRLPVAPGEDEG
jgi:two-component system sensor histidine kinase KdpD